MKNNKYIFTLLLALVILLVTGCKETDIVNEHDYSNKLYVTSNFVNDDLLIKPSEPNNTRKISYRIAMPAKEDITIKFAAAPHLTAAYNLIYGDNAEALAPEFYDIPEGITVIKEGDISSEDIIVNFQNTHQLDKSKRYVLPVTVLDASNIEVLDEKRTVYYIFKGAALINIVADIKEMYFPINWQSNVSNMKTITVEALLRSKDWVAGRDNALSTIFGIEGSFLVRVGDADRPRDQLQVVAPGGGNFPGPHAVSGLPVNEWVHIAVIYDIETNERAYYKDGVKVYSDASTGGALNLTRSCYIGKAWDDTRWLPGEISELRIWSVKRTSEEIANNPYEVDPASSGLVAYWKFNDGEGAGSKIKDHTGNGNDINSVGGIPRWVNVELPPIK